MPFLMIRNDITKVAADAIVNPANRNLLQGSGTSHAIYQAAGEQELTAACEAIGHCDLGRAVCTPAFGLPAKYIFHAVCPAWHGGGFGEAEQLAGAYHSALELAAEHHCESVAFPLLSSGNYGYPKEQAFRIAVDTITQYVMEHDLTVYLVLYDRHSLAVSRKLFASVEEYIDDHYVAQNDESYQFDRRRRELAAQRWRLEEEAAPMLETVAAPSPPATPMVARSLESLMDNLGESFTTRLLRLIDERGLKDSTVYKQSNISRQHFSKIQCNRDYNPKKKTVLAFAVGLHLSEDETIDLLKSAGYAFSDGSKRDWIVRYCLEHKIYNINQVNTLLFEYDQEQLGA
ncbi:macro domain-containing protein [Faecalibacterium prausnitzii]|uniref:macro domain-containing protein n=1 Tax=Faecalibacterium prausnitzii TaxID=853 RepID=UPI0022E680FA|nr:macro domain-containing protein [Faecalibacterium prausnitzii]